MEFFTQQLVNGITLGSLYALLAIGYSIVYGVIGLLNFAQGEVYMVGAFIGFGVLTGLGGPSALTVPVALALVLMFAAAALGSGVLGVLIERVAFRPLRDSSRMAPLITALGVSIFLQNSVLLLLGPDIRNYESSSYIPVTSGIHVGFLRISLVRILVIVTAVVADGCPHALREAHESRAGDALRLVRPRGRRDDGRRHRSDDHDAPSSSARSSRGSPA